MTDQAVNHDYTQSNNLQVTLQQLTHANEFELVEQIFALSDRPEVLGLLVYKLVDERKKTNDLIADLNKKYEEIVKILVNREEQRVENPVRTEVPSVQVPQKKDLDNLLLAEQDKAILKIASGKAWISAKDIKESLNYKGLNAASQRLNKLQKEGYLEKQRVGQQVAYVLNSVYK